MITIKGIWKLAGLAKPGMFKGKDVSLFGNLRVPHFSQWLSVFSLFLFSLVAAHAGNETLLQKYVNKPDPAYQYRLVNSVSADGYSTHLIAMDSQHWRKAGEVNRSLWSHWLIITIPEKVTTDIAMLIISGGNNSDTPPELTHKKFLPATSIARASGSIVATLRQVPNQPLLFSGTDEPLSEDGLVAFSWKQAMDSGDYTWAAYLPMVKSAVRAMDTIQSFVADKSAFKIKRFVVTGFSKRGATTWLTAAVDPRVCAISPGVYDVLNFTPSLEHHFASYGFYSAAIDDYVNFGILNRLHTPEGQVLQKIVDPYHYLKALDIPIFIINSAGDEFFPSDSARFYFEALPADRLMRYIPNTDHSLREPGKGSTGAITSLLSWYQTIIKQKKRPTIRRRQQDSRLTVMTDQTPSAVRLWQTSNPTARDFRLETTGRTWQSKTLGLSANGEYRVDVLPPEKGWTAWFMELQYDTNGFPQTYTSRIFISPERFKNKPD